MKERPILFSAPMVRAILDGKKTQTRRVVKVMPECKCSSELKHQPKHAAPYFDSYCGEKKTEANPRGMSAVWNWWTRDDRPDTLSEIKCPYGQPGDQLWVRESWQYANWTEDGYPFIRFQADGAVLLNDSVPSKWSEQIEATWATLSQLDNFMVDGKAADRRWRPSIHMPRWASRIDLLIKSIRVERLNEISEADAKAEGVDISTSLSPSLAREAFISLWESINGTDSWKQNPWVWVIEFEVMK